jgi:CheY-like chemotaxis protein
VRGAKGIVGSQEGNGCAAARRGGYMSGARVLIIEDSPTTRSVIKVYLLGRNLEFLEAADGLSGFETARTQRPQVIVVDLKMPGMDGLSFCRAVRGDAQIRRTPIILLTGSKHEDVKREAFKAGADHFMTKPIDGPALARCIMDCLKKATAA